MHSDLRVVVIMANTEYAAQQTWGEEISVAHRKIVARYKYNNVHNAESISEILRILATADAARDRKKIQGAVRIGRHGHPGDNQASTAGSTTAGAPSIKIGERQGERPRRDNLIQIRARTKKGTAKTKVRQSPFLSTSRSPPPPPSRRKRTTSWRACIQTSRERE